LAKLQSSNANPFAAASAIALYLAGETDLKTLAMAAVAGFAGPLLKWLDNSAPEFGRGSK